MDRRRNNFDLLRLIGAIVVIFYHTAPISGHPSLQFFGLLNGQMMLEGFFIVSGFLIFQSYERSQSLAEYTENRVRRIYPAYAVVVLLSALLGVTISTVPWGEYFNGVWVKYLVCNLIFLNSLQHTLPGVFSANPMPVVNGALWSIKVEVMFYAAIPLTVYLCRRFGWLPILALGYLLSFCYRSYFDALFIATGQEVYWVLEKQFPGQVMFFFSGAACYYYRPVFERHQKLIFAVAFPALVLCRFVPVPFVSPFLYPVTLAAVVMYVGLCAPYLGNFGKFGDLSYGMYIVHFPLLQALTLWGVFEWSPALGVLLAFVLVFTAALLSWHLVEKRFLRPSSHYIAAVEPAAKGVAARSHAARIHPFAPHRQ